MTEDEKIQRRIAENRHNEIVDLLKAIAFPGYVPESIKAQREKDLNDMILREGKQYKTTTNEKSTD
ncbi:MAG: hypothetical protein IPJ02_18075 [Chitinophagaceae bacterium]|nr:hypothetical protein [Chitinophagaceae bacterium]